MYASALSWWIQFHASISVACAEYNGTWKKIGGKVAEISKVGSRHCKGGEPTKFIRLLVPGWIPEFRDVRIYNDRV